MQSVDALDVSRLSHRTTLLEGTLKETVVRQGTTLLTNDLADSPAFTNVIAKKLGRFELVAGSTISQDEIGKLPLDLQTKFLCIRQSKKLQRVAGIVPAHCATMS